MQGTILILDKLCEVPYERSALLHYPGYGYKVTVKGRISDNPSQFAINIVDETGAILIHINPRWAEQCVVFNAFNRRTWGVQEYSILNLEANETFDIGITDKDDCFWVTINNEVEVEFVKRFKPVTDVRTVQVCKVERDDITLDSVQMDEF